MCWLGNSTHTTQTRGESVLSHRERGTKIYHHRVPENLRYIDLISVIEQRSHHIWVCGHFSSNNINMCVCVCKGHTSKLFKTMRKPAQSNSAFMFYDWHTSFTSLFKRHTEFYTHRSSCVYVCVCVHYAEYDLVLIPGRLRRKTACVLFNFYHWI